jgi:hypothetical protein
MLAKTATYMAWRAFYGVLKVFIAVAVLKLCAMCLPTAKTIYSCLQIVRH